MCADVNGVFWHYLACCCCLLSSLLLLLFLLLFSCCVTNSLSFIVLIIVLMRSTNKTPFIELSSIFLVRRCQEKEKYHNNYISDWPVTFRKNLPRLQPAGSPWWAQEAAAVGWEVALKWALHSCPIPQRVRSSLSWGRPSCRLRKHKDHQSWIKALRGQRKLWTDSSLTQSWPFVVHSGLIEPGQIPNRLYKTVKRGSVKCCKLRHLVTTSARALTSVQPSESHQFPLSCGHPRLNHSPRFCTAIIRVTSLKWHSRAY